MNLMGKLFLATCAFAIVTRRVATSAQDQDSKPPKILSLTFSPPGPILEGTQVNATARIYSTLGEPECSWIVFGVEKKSIKKSLTVPLSDNEYESTGSLGPIHRKSDVFLDVSNIPFHGTVSKHIEFDFDVKVGRPCKTPQQCLLLSNNTECDPEKKICFCEPGYGVDYETDDKACKKLPFRKVKNLKLEDGIDQDCKVYYPNVTEINWFRDGVHCTYGSSCSQDPEIRYDEDNFYYQRRLWLFNVYANHTYTCQVTTTDGKNWTVTENQVKVGIKFDKTRRMTPGSNEIIFCALKTTRYQIRLVRDGKDFCTPDAPWCKQREPTKEQSDNEIWFDVLNLRVSHTFTCEAYDGDERIATNSVFYFLIGEIPKIKEITFSPPGILPKETEVVATARILSPTGQPDRVWKLSNRSEQHLLNESLTVLPENIYESRATLGPIRPGNTLSFQVSNSFGKDEKEIKLPVAVAYFDFCDSMAVCTINNNTECSQPLMRCFCRHGYEWDSATEICRPDAEILQPCVISNQCVLHEGECDPDKKKCYCKTAYGIDYEENNKACKYYPFRKVKSVQFEQDVHLKCQVLSSNLSQILWFRTGRDLCTKDATWCSQDETTTFDEELFFYSRNLTVRNVIRDATYTCQATAGDGKKWDVSETEVVVAPKHESTTYQTFSEDHNINCTITTPNLEVRLVRDGKESCTPGATWCSQTNDTWAIQKSTTFFDILNQRANSTYTCEVYRDNEKLATVEVYHILIDSKPKILELALSHPGPVQKGTEVVATARFYSPLERPDCNWALNNEERDLKCESTVLTENIYESKTSLGPIDRSTDVLFSLKTIHGEDSKIIKVDTSAGAMHKEGIIMIALTILFTLFRSTA